MKIPSLRNIFTTALLTLSLTTIAQERDWANIARYKSANKEFLSENRLINAVFIGNSITEGWVGIDTDFFVANNYLGRGISGQISTQMLLRMREDVIKLNPSVVVINAGTNDIAENANVYDPEITFGNIVSMAQLAQANNIKVVLASVLPANHFRWNPNIANVADKVLDLNRRIREYADDHSIPYIDYHTPLKDKDNGLAIEYGEDGVHPNLEGYRIMEPLAKQAIDKALQQ